MIELGFFFFTIQFVLSSIVIGVPAYLGVVKSDSSSAVVVGSSSSGAAVVVVVPLPPRFSTVYSGFDKSNLTGALYRHDSGCSK